MNRPCLRSLSGAVLLVTVLISIFISGHAGGITEQGALHTLNGRTMGTTWSALWSAPSADVNNIEKTLLDELQRINALMSTWDPDSELSRFNSMASVEPVRLHPDTLHVIDTAIQVSRMTGGKYDVTLDPVIRLWGFGRNASEIPDPAAIRQAMQYTGYQKLVRAGDTIRKLNPKLTVDLSSLAKGFAVDQLGRILEEFKVQDYLVEIGGEVRARGVRHTGEPWRIGVEDPNGQVQRGIRLLDSQVASSGSYRNYRMENGKRLSHIIDGSSGFPVDHQLVAVTVLHESTMLADAWATALLVVGETQALALVRQMGLAAQLTVHQKNDFRVERTDAFIELLLDQSG